MAMTCSCCGESVDLWVQLRSHPEVHICHWCVDSLNRQRDGQLRGQGWTAEGFEPIFTVADVSKATDHYAKMGFEIDVHDETYAFAHRDRDLTIHLTQAESEPTTGALYIHCPDADQLADAWRKAGLAVVGPEDKDYGKREGSHTDPDGNLIRFGSPLGR
jgi:hypothetical protein